MKTNDEKQPETAGAAPSLIAWHVAEHGARKFWTRIGAAWPHGDGEGINLTLELMPVSGGRIVLRTPRTDDNPPE